MENTNLIQLKVNILKYVLDPTTTEAQYIKTPKHFQPKKVVGQGDKVIMFGTSAFPYSEEQSVLKAYKFYPTGENQATGTSVEVYVDSIVYPNGFECHLFEVIIPQKQ